jgi:hypothetical protein
MNLYKITRGDDEVDYNQYDSAVVAATSPSDAKTIHPDGSYVTDERKNRMYDTWVPLSEVEVTYLGKAAKGVKRGVIIASFNAG